MLISEAINQILARGEDVPGVDNDDDDRRVRAQENLNEIWIEVWDDRSWPHKRKTAQLTIPATQGYIAVPTDFDGVGHYGGVYLTATGFRLGYIDPQELQSAKRIPGNRSGDNPSVYSLYDQETATPFELRLQIITNSNELVLDVNYDKAPPYLDEDDDDSDINMIAEHWQRAVLIPGAKALAKLNLGDITAQQYDLQKKRLLGLMRGSERPGQDSTEKLPSFLGEN